MGYIQEPQAHQESLKNQMALVVLSPSLSQHTSALSPTWPIGYTTTKVSISLLRKTPKSTQGSQLTVLQ